MTTEEVDLNERLEHHGLESVETDLGEYILQLAHEKPYHIVAPALHMTRYDVAEIFTKQLNVPHEIVIEKQTAIARAVLRQKFLAADIGISGANFLVADSGAVVIIENEGNARLTTSAPKIHIAVAGIEKVIPRAQDLATFLKLLARSATGQLLSVYTSFLSGPRRPGEVDGPDEFYVVLLDNGRTKLLPDRSKRQSLYCIRCGACLNTCPVYRKIGGHSFPVGLLRPDRRHHHAAIHGRRARARAAVRIEPLRRLRRSLPGQDRHPQDAAGTPVRRQEERDAREAEPPRETGVPRLRLADDPSAPVRTGRPDGRGDGPRRRRQAGSAACRRP